MAATAAETTRCRCLPRPRMWVLLPELVALHCKWALVLAKALARPAGPQTFRPGPSRSRSPAVCPAVSPAECTSRNKTAERSPRQFVAAGIVGGVGAAEYLADEDYRDLKQLDEWRHRAQRRSARRTSTVVGPATTAAVPKARIVIYWQNSALGRAKECSYPLLNVPAVPAWRQRRHAARRTCLSVCRACWTG